MTTTRVKDSTICMTLTHASVKKAVKSQTMSKRYINTMLRATIINILYHRLDISEKEFLTKDFNNIPFKTFRSKSSNVLIREFHTYMLACKDALEKNYLREFYLYFIEVASGDIIENYKFSFQYAEKSEPHLIQKEEKLIDSTCELLKTLEELGKHKKFNSDIQLKVEFTYFDDTPEEYEPPGFRSIQESESLVRKISKTGNSVSIGTLFTGFHSLKCRGKGDVFNFNSSTPSNTESEVNACDGDIDIDEVDLEEQQMRQCSVQAVINTDDMLTEDLSPAINGLNRTAKSVQDIAQMKMNDTYISQYIDISSEEEVQVNCPCKLPVMEFCTVDQIECVSCKRVVHAPCHGYLDKTFMREPFRCTNCEGDADSVLGAFDAKQAKGLHRIRYIFGALYKYQKIPDEFKTVFDETWKNMENLKVLEFEGNAVKAVNINVLSNMFKFDHKKPDLQRFQNISKI